MLRFTPPHTSQVPVCPRTGTLKPNNSTSNPSQQKMDNVGSANSSVCFDQGSTTPDFSSFADFLLHAGTSLLCSPLRKASRVKVHVCPSSRSFATQGRCTKYTSAPGQRDDIPAGSASKSEQDCPWELPKDQKASRGVHSLQETPTAPWLRCSRKRRTKSHCRS